MLDVARSQGRAERAEGNGHKLENGEEAAANRE
jgi:hypothetical protein